MKKLFFFLLVSGNSFFVFGQPADETLIHKAMEKQVAAWNSGNIDEFMKGYWQNDSLMFIGHGGITYGYNNTLNNYKKNYDSKDKMGTLFFSDLKFKKLATGYYFVIGKWFLKRNTGDVGGYYTLLFRKINGRWLIVCDHTS